FPEPAREHNKISREHRERKQRSEVALTFVRRERTGSRWGRQTIRLLRVERIETRRLPRSRPAEMRSARVSDLVLLELALCFEKCLHHSDEGVGRLGRNL